jgi:hypothetical protein
MLWLCFGLSGLTVTTALNARRAGPYCFASCHKIVDEFCEGFEWIDLSGIGSALSHKIDATAAQKDEKMKTIGPAVIPPFAIVKPTEESS